MTEYAISMIYHCYTEDYQFRLNRLASHMLKWLHLATTTVRMLKRNIRKTFNMTSITWLAQPEGLHWLGFNSLHNIQDLLHFFAHIKFGIKS